MPKADHRGDDHSAAGGEEERSSNASWDVNHGIEEGVQPGSLLGPITGLGFSADGGLLFSCSGSSLSVFDVRSGVLLSTVRVLPPGVAVYGLDIGRGSGEPIKVGGRAVENHIFIGQPQSPHPSPSRRCSFFLFCHFGDFSMGI